MRNSISTYTLYNQHVLVATESLVNQGWKAIEIMGEGKEHGRPFMQMSAKQIMGLRNMLNENDVTLGFHMPVMNFNPALPDEETERIWLECRRMLDIIPFDYVLLHPGKNDSIEEGIKNATQFGQKLLAQLPEATTIVFENVPNAKGAIGTSVSELIAIVEQLDQKRAKIMFDTGHSYMNHSTNILEECRKALPYLFGLHINDNHGQHDEHLQIGEGTIPFQQIFEIVKGRQLHLVFETNTVERANRSRMMVRDFSQMMDSEERECQQLS
ncbi:sugar phosphate isomerase/epimerase family protein [Bacillus sp. JJ722]|uniref:sugar phosphate isomerase/epimerase family protein n=1 Tax=Bacillus sp. JJ722 TaxID=3122973 RepID=UPI002FFD67AE